MTKPVSHYSMTTILHDGSRIEHSSMLKWTKFLSGFHNSHRSDRIACTNENHHYTIKEVTTE